MNSHGSIGKMTSWTAFVVCCGIVFTLLVACQSTPASVKPKQLMKQHTTFEEDLLELNASAEKHQLMEFNRQADSLLAKWDRKDSTQVPVLLKAICSHLSSYDFQPREARFAALRRYASVALFETQMPFPLEDHFTLLDLLVYANRQMGWEQSADFSKERKRVAESWLANWATMQTSRNPDFDMKNAPDLTVPPPVGMPVGVAPEEVADPVARQAYESAIEKNRQKAQACNDQQVLHQLQLDYRPIMKTFLVEAYQLPPKEVSELQELMDRYRIEVSFQKEIRKGIEQK